MSNDALALLFVAIFLIVVVLAGTFMLITIRIAPEHRRARLLAHEWTPDEWDALPEAPPLVARPFNQETD